jgi:hypothetical protein
VKRILIIAILFSYSIASMGISLNYFYCCGKLKTVTISANTQENNLISNSDKGCCKNKTVSIKLKTDQKNHDQSAYNFLTPVAAILPSLYSYTTENSSFSDFHNPLYKRPPPQTQVSRRLLYCVFKI